MPTVRIRQVMRPARQVLTTKSSFRNRDSANAFPVSEDRLGLAVPIKDGSNVPSSGEYRSTISSHRKKFLRSIAPEYAAAYEDRSILAHAVDAMFKVRWCEGAWIRDTFGIETRKPKTGRPPAPRAEKNAPVTQIELPEPPHANVFTGLIVRWKNQIPPSCPGGGYETLRDGDWVPIGAAEIEQYKGSILYNPVGACA